MDQPSMNPNPGESSSSSQYPDPESSQLSNTPWDARYGAAQTGEGIGGQVNGPKRALPRYMTDWDWSNQFPRTPAASANVNSSAILTPWGATTGGGGYGGSGGYTSIYGSPGGDGVDVGARKRQRVGGESDMAGGGTMDWQSQFRSPSAVRQPEIAARAQMDWQSQFRSPSAASHTPVMSQVPVVVQSPLPSGEDTPVASKPKRKYVRRENKDKPVKDTPVKGRPTKKKPAGKEITSNEAVGHGVLSNGRISNITPRPDIFWNRSFDHEPDRNTDDIQRPYDPPEAMDSYGSPTAFESPRPPTAFEPSRARVPVESFDIPMSGIEPENENNGWNDSGWNRELPGDEADDSMDEEDDDPYYRDHAAKMKKLRNDILQLRNSNQNFSSTLDGTAPRTKKKPNRSKEIAPRGRQHGQKVGVRKAAELSGDIKRRLARAVTLFQNEQEYEAAEALEEIIRLNAEVPAAWLLLAGIYEDDGQIDRALRCLIMAAHTSTKSTTPWINAAVLAESQHGLEREYYLSQAQFCYSAAIRNEPKSMECRRARAAILEERGKRKTAISEYRNIATREPGDVDSLRRLAELCIDHGKAQVALDTYKESIKYFRGLDPEDAEAFDWTQVDTYITLYEVIAQYYSAIAELKSLSRWLLGREEDDFWDSITFDDSEWDIDETRKAKVPGYVSGKYPPEAYELPLEFRVRLGVFRLWIQNYDEALHHFDFLDPLNTNGDDKVQDYPHLFLQAATELYRKEYFEKALLFYEPLLGVAEYYDSALFVSIGRCLLKLGQDARAEQMFGDAVLMDDNDVNARMEMAKIHEKRNELHKALNFVNEAMILRKSQKRRELDEAQGLLGGEDVVNMQGRYRAIRPKDPNQHTGSAESEEPTDAEGPTANAGPKAPKARKAPKESKEPKAPKEPKEPKERITKPKAPRQLKPRVDYIAEDQRAHVLSKGEILINHYRTLQGTRNGMRNQERPATYAWLEAAKALTDDFRSCKAFYPWDKYIKFLGYSGESALDAATPLDTDLSEIADRLAKNLGADVSMHKKDHPSSIPTTYRDLAFTEWLDIFAEYALTLAKEGFTAESYEICHSIEDAVVFYRSREDKFLTHLVHGVCALISSDEETCVTQARYFMREYQFTTDSYRLYGAFTRAIHSPVSWYSSGPSQKFILRQIKCMDLALIHDDRRKKMAVSERGGYSATDEKGHLIINDDMDISLLMLYGHILYVGQSHAYALNYFFRAYALDPDHPMIHLCIGLTYCHHALKRQCENRQHHILQGMTFLNMYHEVRIKSEAIEERQEAHYNLARMYHVLGLNHLAIPYYQKVLDEVKGGQRSEREDITVDAAYNLQTMYAITGNMELAREVTRKWLVL